MTIREHEVRVAGQVAEDRNAQAAARLLQKPPMAVSADPVEHDARHGHVVAVVCKAGQRRCGRGRLPPDIEHQDDRPSGEGREVGGGSGSVRGPVEQPHDPFADHQFDVAGRLGNQGRDGVRPHRPAIDIEAGPAAGGGMEGRVDEIGADLDRTHRQAGLAEMAQQCQGERGLAAARCRRGDQQAGGGQLTGPRMCTQPQRIGCQRLAVLGALPIQGGAQAHHFSHHDHGRRFDAFPFGSAMAVRQIGFQHPLVRRGGLADQGDGLVRRRPAAISGWRSPPGASWPCRRPAPARPWRWPASRTGRGPRRRHCARSGR